jgi:hypothetical protein
VGYHPLLTSMTNTKEPLYPVNRSGIDTAAPWQRRRKYGV